MPGASASEVQRDLKSDVRQFWDQAACGEIYATGTFLLEQLEAQAKTRYELEPYIAGFARFPEGRGKDVLEIGVGMGADHLQWAQAEPRSLAGVDLTARAIAFTRARLSWHNLTSKLSVGDAEHLPFPDDSFDLIYSWGVLHHTPDTRRAIQESWRVLRRGGTARVMIYHTYSPVGYLLWFRYGLLSGRPWRGLAEIYAHHLESPGTKAYTQREGRCMFARFSDVEVRSELSFGDLLLGEVGQRHRSLSLNVAKRLWPRWLIRRLFRRHGLFLLIEAVK